MSEVSSLIELNDADVIRIEAVLKTLQEKQRKYVALEKFRQEIIERFGLAGFGVKVSVWDTNAESVYHFDIEIERRLEGQFDPDQMVWEATRDVLNIGEGGVIKTSGIVTPGTQRK